MSYNSVYTSPIVGLPMLNRFPANKQKRLDALLEANSEGDLSVDERDELKDLVHEAEALMAKNARHLSDISKSETAPATPATPVTVWVKLQSAG